MKDTISASDLPKHCRTWDDKRRAWVPKTRYADAMAARAAAGKKMRAYRCVAGEHFHIGHTSKSAR